MSEPSFLWKESACCFSCKGAMSHFEIHIEIINHEGRFCVLLIPVVYRSCHDSTLLTTDLTVAHEVIYDSIGVSLQKTGFNGSISCQKSESCKKGRLGRCFE